MDKKRVFIIHRWESNPNSDWYPWLKKELEQKGFEVIVPIMPEPESPKLETWIPTLLQLINMIDRNTYFVGHSIGCQAIMRYLEVCSDMAGGAVFVAPWIALSENALEEEKDEQTAKPWLETPIDLEKIKGTILKSAAIFSDDDPFVPLDLNASVFKERLNSKIIIEKGKGHFTEDEGVTELPELLEEILLIAGRG